MVVSPPRAGYRPVSSAFANLCKKSMSVFLDSGGKFLPRVSKFHNFFGGEYSGRTSGWGARCAHRCMNGVAGHDFAVRTRPVANDTMPNSDVTYVFGKWVPETKGPRDLLIPRPCPVRGLRNGLSLLRRYQLVTGLACFLLGILTMAVPLLLPSAMVGFCGTNFCWPLYGVAAWEVLVIPATGSVCLMAAFVIVYSARFRNTGSR